jgi:hypothetical protein
MANETTARNLASPGSRAAFQAAMAAFSALDENLIEPVLDHVRPAQRSAVRDGLLLKMSDAIYAVLVQENLL